MAEIATNQRARIVYEAVVLRARPCARHAAYEAGCADCLTGEQAAALGVDHDRHELGVIATSDLSAAEAAGLGFIGAARHGLNRIAGRLRP